MTEEQRCAVFITSATERSSKKLPQKVQDFIARDLPEILGINPLIGELLAPPFVALRSFHFSIEGKKYRVAYEFDRKQRKIVIHFAGYRGGFYERLRRLLRH